MSERVERQPAEAPENWGTTDDEFMQEVLAAMPVYLRSIHALKEERAAWVDALFVALRAIVKARESAASGRSKTKGKTK